MNQEKREGSPSQASKFEEAAREAGADESEEHFKARLHKIAKAKMKDEAPPKPLKDTRDAEG